MTTRIVARLICRKQKRRWSGKESIEGVRSTWQCTGGVEDGDVDEVEAGEYKEQSEGVDGGGMDSEEGGNLETGNGW